MQPQRLFLLLGAIFGLLAVIAGTFAAHFLDKRLSSEMLPVFETGVRYHMYHALALLAVAGLSTQFNNAMPTTAGWCFAIGITIFSGSLYLLAITEIRWLGAITPIGGLAFLAGWVMLALAAFKN